VIEALASVELRQSSGIRRIIGSQITVVQTARSAAILVAGDGLGPWTMPEMQACLLELRRRQRPLIPVLLPGAAQQPALPLFLQQFAWVDLRAGIAPGGLDRLEWGITGRKPPPRE
jgi:hypothetical protein